MYLEFIGTLTDKDLEKYPSVHLTSLMNGTHLSEIMYTQMEMGSLHILLIHVIGLNLIPIDEFGDYVNRVIQIINILDDTPQTSLVHNLCANKHALTHTSTEYEKLRPSFDMLSNKLMTPHNGKQQLIHFPLKDI